MQGADIGRLYQRNHVELHITIEDEAGNPLPLEGSSIVWVARREINSNPASGPVVLRKELGDGIDIVDTGRIRVTLSSSDLNLSPGGYWFEVRIVDAEGHPYTATQRRFTIWATLVEED